MALISFLFLIFVWSLFEGVIVNAIGIVSAPVGCVKFSEIGICSNHGRCVHINNNSLEMGSELPDSKCLCDPGWTGASDLVNMKNHDCAQNIFHTKFIYSLDAALGFIVIFYSTYKLIKSVFHLFNLIQELYKERTQKSPSSHTRTLSETSSMDVSSASINVHPPTATSVTTPTVPPPPVTSTGPPPIILRNFIQELLSWDLTITSVGSLIEGLCLVIVGILRASNNGEEYVIGKSWITTLFWPISVALTSGFHKRSVLQWTQIRGKVARFTTQNVELHKKTLRQITISVYVVYGFDFICFILILCLLGFPQSSNIIICLWFTLMGLGMTIIAVELNHSGKKLEAILMDGLDRLPGTAKEERERALKNIRAIKKFTNNIFTLIPQQLLVAFWPFIRTKATYLVTMPFQSIFHLLLVHHGVYPSSILNPNLFISETVGRGSIVSLGGKIKNDKSDLEEKVEELKPLASHPNLENNSSTRESSLLDVSSHQTITPGETPYLPVRTLEDSGREAIPLTPSFAPVIHENEMSRIDNKQIFNPFVEETEKESN